MPKFLKSFTTSLHNGYVWLTNFPGQLIWSRNLDGGVYTPILAYIILREDEDIPLDPWWASKIWELQISLKNKIFT